ncbi:DUF945 family protein [Chitinimonas arctica]|uniref:DUF945 family protein n=1 Tax=Chitinimonas arctica TaxID=2594795 RepID=UPI0015D4570D|nr:DUF945 family protein [Chitinimonas arctica]
MKKIFKAATLATMLSLSFAAHAETQPQPPAEAKVADAAATPREQALKELKQSELFQTYLAVVGELVPAVSSETDMARLVERLNQFEFSPATQQKLVKLFGNPKPLHLEKKLLADGSMDVRIKLDPLKYRDSADESLLEWSGINGNSVFNKTLDHAVTALKSDSMVFDSKAMHVAVTDMRMDITQDKASELIWWMTANAKVASIAIEEKSKEFKLTLDDFSYDMSMQPDGKNVDVKYGFLVKRINWGKESVDDARFAIRLSGIDRATLETIVAESRKLQARKLTPEAQMNEGMGVILTHGKALLKHGMMLEVQDISAKYHGHKAELKGFVKVAGLKDADFNSFERAAKKVQARFDAQVPMALATEVGETLMRAELEKRQSDKKVTDAEVKEGTKMMIEQLMEKPLKEKWFRLEDGQIRSTFEFKQGKFILNGKVIPIPLGGSTKSKPKSKSKAK